MSNSVMSVFRPLKKTIGKISESMNKMLYVKEECQIENIRIEEEMSMNRHAEIAAIRLYIARQVQIPRLLAGSFYPILRINCRDEPSLEDYSACMLTLMIMNLPAGRLQNLSAGRLQNLPAKKKNIS